MFYISGIVIFGNDAALVIGNSSQLTCSSDLHPLMIEWLWDSKVIIQTEGEDALLVFPAVNDSLHERVYRCRITTSYGVLERNVTIVTRCKWQ